MTTARDSTARESKLPKIMTSLSCYLCLKENRRHLTAGTGPRAHGVKEEVRFDGIKGSRKVHSWQEEPQATWGSSAEEELPRQKVNCVKDTGQQKGLR